MRTTWLAALGVLIVSAAMAADERGVTYRVTYGSGIVADVLAPPETNGGIKSVLRIVAVPAAVTLSTDDNDSDAAGKLTMTPMAWDGKAWIVPAPAGATQRAAAIQPSTDDNLVASEIRKTEQLLRRMMDSLKSLAHAVADAQRKRDALDADDEAAARAAADRLADLRRQRDSMLQAVESYRQRLTALETLAKEETFVTPAGQVRSDRAPASAPAREAAKAEAPAHHVQVTRLATGTGRRTYRISLPHAQVGSAGAFYFVAYADTNGDGVPDKLIARSPLAQSVLAGGWSTWTFATSERNVFAGNAWVGDDVVLAGRPAPQGEAAGSLKQEYFVSGFFGKTPDDKRAFVPYLQDIRVEIPQDSDGENMDSEIIVK